MGLEIYDPENSAEAPAALKAQKKVANALAMFHNWNLRSINPLNGPYPPFTRLDACRNNSIKLPKID